MRKQSKRGSVLLEFALVFPLFLVPMLLFTWAIGFNLLQALETIQFARDAGHLYVTLNYGQQQALSGTQFTAVLNQVGQSLGFQASGPSTAGVIFSKIVFVDDPTCILGGASAGCANSGHWVYEQYYSTGTMPTGYVKLPALNTPSGGTGTYNCGTTSGCGASDADGNFSLNDSVTKSSMQVGDTAFSALGITSWGTSGPAGQIVFLIQVGSQSFQVPGVVTFPAIRDYAVF